MQSEPLPDGRSPRRQDRAGSGSGPGMSSREGAWAFRLRGVRPAVQRPVPTGRRGFAVVADEVRKLAEQSSRASGQISELIKDIQKEINLSIQAITEGNTAVNDGKKLVEEAGSEFENIAKAVDKVSIHVKDIFDESQQIKNASEKMVDEVDHLAKISTEAYLNTQEIASASEQQNSSMEEIATSAEDLAHMAENLRDAAQGFKM